MVANHFISAAAAARYAKGRPYVHRQIVAEIGKVCGRVQHALDVGCGTGQSSWALLELAESVTGVDVSAEMLRNGIPDPRITYVQAPAENLPLEDRSVGLVTAGLAFHWFDRPAFLGEAARVLEPQGWLAIYGDGFSGEMVGNAAYAEWNRDQYVRRCPTPPRHSVPMSVADAAAHGFDAVTKGSFDHEVRFSPGQLVDYLMTQSNVTARVESGHDSSEEIAVWLTAETGPFFTSPDAGFRFTSSFEIFRIRL